MRTWLVQLNQEKPYRQSVNVTAEILDDAADRMNQSRSILTIKREAGLKRISGRWLMTYDVERVYSWDDFEGEWERVK